MLQTSVLLIESTAADTNTILHLQQKQQQFSLAEQPEATAEPAAAAAKQGNDDGPAVQQQQASTDELPEPAAATCDKVDKSAMGGSPADAQSRASSANAGASAAANAGPSGHGCQIEVNQLQSGFVAIFIYYQCLPSRRLKALLAFVWQHAFFDQFKYCEHPCSHEPSHTCYQNKRCSG